MWRNNSLEFSRTPSPDFYNGSGGRYSPYSSTGDKSRSQSPQYLKTGDRVIIRSSVGDAKAGLLRYFGEVDFAQGVWAGIELFYPQGKNDGTVLGVEYFRCKHPYGLFVPLHKVDLIQVLVGYRVVLELWILPYLV